jgi:hypothetical protein
MGQSKKIARTAGLLYLIIIVCAGFSQGYVRSTLIVPGEAAQTAGNIIASVDLFRLGFASDLIAFMSDLAVAIIFYILLRPVNNTLSLLAASFRLVAHPAIASVNLLNHYAALLLLSGSDYLKAFEADQLYALALLFLNIHKYGYLLAGAFFGLHCLLLGYLIFKSDLFPSILGVFMVFASLGYLTESFGIFLFPAFETLFAWFVAVPAVIAEMSLCMWLLFKGVKEQ